MPNWRFVSPWDRAVPHWDCDVQPCSYACVGCIVSVYLIARLQSVSEELARHQAQKAAIEREVATIELKVADRVARAQVCTLSTRRGTTRYDILFRCDANVCARPVVCLWCESRA
jgi:hypothetical protein